MRSLLAAVILSAGLAVPAGATVPGFTDPAGDANLVNGQGVAPVPEGGPDTRPASVDGADLVEGVLATTHHPVPVTDDDGRLVAVRHVPDGLLLTLRTAGAVASPGPTIAIVWSLRAGPCEIEVRAYVRGAGSRTDDPQGGEALAGAGCQGGQAVHPLTPRLDGAELRLRLPLVPGIDVGGSVGGAGARSAVATRVPAGDAVLGPLIDVAPSSPALVVGSDVPPDVDCLAEPDDPACLAAAGGHDTGRDLHSALLDSEPAARSAPTLEVGEEYGVYSVHPRGRWLHLPFDVSGVDEPWIEIDIASRLIEDGEMSEEWLPFDNAIALWRIYTGPADDPHRNLFTVINDTPYGFVVSVPSDGVERVTILGGVDVDTDADVGLILAVHGSHDGFFGEPFPSVYAEWVESWTAGREKVRLAPEHVGTGLQASLWATSVGTVGGHNLHDVQVLDDRVGLQGTSGPGPLRVVSRHEVDGPALSAALVSRAVAGSEAFELAWRTPASEHVSEGQIQGSGSYWARTSAVDAGAGEYATDLRVDTLAETGDNSLFVHATWPLDPAEVLPGATSSFASNPPEGGFWMLERGTITRGPTPSVLVGRSDD